MYPRNVFTFVHIIFMCGGFITVFSLYLSKCHTKQHSIQSSLFVDETPNNQTQNIKLVADYYFHSFLRIKLS